MKRCGASLFHQTPLQGKNSISYHEKRAAVILTAARFDHLNLFFLRDHPIIRFVMPLYNLGGAHRLCPADGVCDDLLDGFLVISGYRLVSGLEIEDFALAPAVAAAASKHRAAFKPADKHLSLIHISRLVYSQSLATCIH